MNPPPRPVTMPFRTRRRAWRAAAGALSHTHLGTWYLCTRRARGPFVSEQKRSGQIGAAGAFRGTFRFAAFFSAAAPGGRERTAGRATYLGAHCTYTRRAPGPFESRQKRSVPAFCRRWRISDGEWCRPVRHAQRPRDACQCEQWASGRWQPGALGRAPLSRAMALLFKYCRLRPNTIQFV